jgi:ParB family chromosome partitioning protein
MDIRTGKESMKAHSLQRQAPIWVDLDDIAQEPGPYTMSYGFKLDVLCESIQKVGLINPPLITRNEKGGFNIVSGYRRLLAMRALGESKALCKDVTSVLPSPLERFLANFYENLVTRKFNDIEKAMILHKLRGHMAEEEILASFMPLLSLPSHKDTFEFYLKLITLEEELQLAVAKEEISVKGVKALVELEGGSRQVIFHWLSVLKFNFNQQLKAIEYLMDISKREGRAIPQVLSEEPFLRILENRRLNSPQKAKKAIEALRVRRYPRLARAQEVVESAISAISLPPEVAIRYDPSLEDPNYHLEIGFRDGKDLRKTIQVLHAMDELAGISDPWAGQ